MSRYFNIETDIAQNLINDFFSIYDCQGTIGSILSGKIFNDINHGYRLPRLKKIIGGCFRSL